MKSAIRQANGKAPFQPISTRVVMIAALATMLGALALLGLGWPKLGSAQRPEPAATELCADAPAALVSWFKGEGNSNDAFAGNNGILENGATFAPGLVGQAFSFDGVDDVVSITRSVQDDFTIEFWLNTTQIVGSDGGQWWGGRGLVDGEVISVTNDFGVTLQNGKVLFGVGNPDVTIRSGLVADGNWHQVAATRVRSTGAMKLYVDGSQVATGTGGTQSLTAPPRLTLGRVQVDNNPYQGKLDEVSIYNRALSLAEIQAIFNVGSAGKCAATAPCVPTAPNLISTWKAEGSANDLQGLNHGTLVNGATFSGGRVGQAFSFDGVNDYVRIPDSPTLRPTNVTLEAWINFSASPTGSRSIINKPLGNGILDSYQLFYEGGLLQGLVSDINGLGPRVQFNLPATLGVWYHVAYTFDDTANKQTLYLNGAPLATGTVTKSIGYDNRPLLIGAETENGVEGAFPFPGLIDEAAIYDRALSDAEIQAIANAGTSGKCGLGAIQSFTLNPNPINGGQSSTGTVTLNVAAPAGGAVINLSSSNTAAATVPSVITIAAGQTTGTFSVTTAVPATDATALITATYQQSISPVSLSILAPKPDLRVASACVPASTQTDAAFNISWTIKNDGMARADAPWTDRVLLSSDNQLGSDTLIGDFPFNNNLEANQTADRIQTLTIARNAIGQDGAYFLLIQTDATNQVNEGNSEGNNFVALPINISRPPKPDLIVDSIVAPNTAFFGQTILVQWTVKNIGGGPTNAASWQDFVYLSSDDVPELEDPFKLPVTNISFLAGGESYHATAEVKIPQGLVGLYKIIVWTDGDGTNHRSNSFPHQVFEDNDENNYGVARPIQLATPPLPDLQTISVAAPEQVFAGGQMALTWRVENHGDGVTPPDQTNWLDQIYLSQDATLDVSTDRLVGSRPRSGALIQNEGYTVSGFNITLPNDIAGDWFVFVLADGDNQVYEFNNENNNANYDRQQPGSPLHIAATPPDLVIPNPVTAPATGSSGQPLSLSWTVKNQGAFEAAPNWFDAVYLSADQTLNPESDTLLTSVFRSTALAPGLTYAVTTNLTLPSCLAGTYYLFVVADSRRQIFEFDPNLNAEANNSSPARAIQILDATPDLRVSSVSNPVTGSAGQQLEVNWTVANQGAGVTAATKWTDRVYLMPTQSLDFATSLLIGSFDHLGVLNSGANYTRTESLAIATAAQGSYFVTVVTDANNEVEECANNANNSGVGSQAIAISNDLPDLVVQTASSQSNPVGGQTVAVDWTVTNQGTVAVNNPSWGDAVYFSNDIVLSKDDQRLATAPAAGPLAIGATYSRQVQATLPVVPAGNYFLIIQVDYLANVFEGQHENNNLRTIPVSIQVPPVDLTVTTVNSPATAFSGQDMTVSWTVLNSGNSQTVGSHWIDEVVLSLDQIDDASDRVIGSKQHLGALNAHSSYNDSLSVFVPQGFSGQYYCFVRTDRRNEVAEANENNNSAASGIVFNLTPPSDLVVTSIVAPASAAPGEPMTVNWTVQNSGANPATGLWNDAVYLSSDQTWDIGDLLVGRQTQTGPVAAGQSYNGQLTTTLPALNLGNYYVIVRSDVQNRVRETSDDNNSAAATAQTLIDVTTLQIGVPRSTTLTTGQERFYKTDAPANETLRFALTGQPGSANELYERFGLIASRTSFDQSFSRPNEPNQELIVPSSQGGNYFTSIRSAASIPPTQAVTISAEVIPFGITSVSPNRIGDNGQVTITLKGARFEAGATVKLFSNGATLNAATVIRVDSSTVKARFMFSNAPRGLYDVILTNPGGQMSTVGSAVMIEAARTAQPVIVNHGSLHTRIGRSLAFNTEASNPGNVDIQYAIFRTEVLLTNSQDHLTIVTQRPAESLPRKADFPEIDWNNNPATNARRGDLTSEGFIYRDLAPGQNISFDTEVRGMVNGTPYLRVQAEGQTRIEFIEGIREAAEALRQLVLATNRVLTDPTLLDAIADPDRWFAAYEVGVQFYGYAEGVLEDIVTSRRLALRNLFQGAILDIATNAATAACNSLVDTFTSDCGVRCRFRAGCCTAGAAASLALVLFFPEVGLPIMILSGTSAGVTGGVCIRDATECGAKTDCTEDPAGHGCSAISLLFLEIGDFVKACLDKALDPNEKLSPDGYGPQRFVPIQQDIPYTINFENRSVATAYAQRVRITDQLDPNLDPRTLRLREIGFKQYRFQVPDNRAFFQQRVQLGPDLGNLLADISVGVDIATGTVTWTLTAIDPATGEQPNSANLGLLAPNNDANDGQGFVTFTVKPKATTVTGTVVANEATIVFDTEAAINTNKVSNTIDAEAPSSAVNALPANEPSPTFAVSWAGQDGAGGSGLLSYDIFVAANDGPYQPLLTGTTVTQTQFTGVLNTAYRFYSIARDNSGNVEAAPLSADAATTVGTCTFSLDPTSANLAAGGGVGLFNIITGVGCNWTAQSNVPWITTSSSGAGNGVANFTVAANAGPARSGAITAGGQTFTVNQVAGTVSVSTPSGTDVMVQGGGVSFTLPKVTTAGITTVTPINPASAGQLPNGYQLFGESVAYEITTTATLEFPITTCFAMPSVTDAGAFSRLRVLHGENGSLLDRSATNDFANKRVCAGVPSLSPFVVATTPLPQFQFSAANYAADEGSGSATITVSRLGETSGPATVNYSTSDGTAGQRTDYIIANGTISFAAGEMNKDISVLLVNNLYVDGNRTIGLALTNPNGAPLGTPAAAILTIQDNDGSAPTTNPLDDADERFFVREHYYDFLGRLPDPGGFDFWVGQITQCGGDQACIRTKRIDVSNAFFYELEYQQTAAYVFRLYRAAFGNNQPLPNPDASNPAVSPALQAEARKIPGYTVFAKDRSRLLGSGNLAQDQLALANLFASRPEFLSKYPPALTLDQFVDAVIANLNSDNGVDLSAQRSALIALGNRGAVLYRIADDSLQSNPNNRAFIDAEYNRSFVASQYFGYLRRDADIGGFLFWLGQVSSAPLRDVHKQHAMVCSFTTSAEYQQRFSPIVTHSNEECQH